MALPIAAGDRRDLPYLVAALDDPQDELVQDAQRQLLLAGPEALPLLRAAAEDELARLAGLRPHIDQLVRDLDADEYATREQAQRDLIEVGAEALPALREAAEGGTPEQRERAQEAIERIGTGGPSPLRFLANLARAIGAQADEACVPMLLALAKQPQPDVFTPAIDGLDRLGSQAARGALHTLCADANVDRRWTARAALMALDEPPPGRLADLLTDWPSDPVRLRVACALRRCESPEVVPVALRAFCKEAPDSETARELRTALNESLDDRAVTTAALEALPTAGEKRLSLLAMLREATPEARAALEASLESQDTSEHFCSAWRAASLFGAQAREWVLSRVCRQGAEMESIMTGPLDMILGPEPAPFERVLREHPQEWDAILPFVTRCPRAGTVSDIPDRWGPLTPEEERRLARFFAPVQDHPALAEIPERPGELDDLRQGSVRVRAVRLAQASLGPLPPRPLEGFPIVERLRAIRALPRGEQGKALSSALHDEDPAIRQAAVRWCTILGAEGLEEDVLPFVRGGKTTDDNEARTAEFARLYLAPRRTPSLLDRVRRRALGEAPGRCADLWVDWEAGPAVEGLLRRLFEPSAPLADLLRALSCAPLGPEDAGALLSLQEESLPVEAHYPWHQALVRTGSKEAIDRVAQSAAEEAADGGLRLIEALATTREGAPVALGLLRVYAIAAGPRPPIPWLGGILPHLGNDAAPLMQRVLDRADPGEVSSLASAIVRVDPTRARGIAKEWIASTRLQRRVAALTIARLMGEDPPAEAYHRETIRHLLEDCPSRRALEAAPSLLVDPDHATAVWHLLASATAHLPEGVGNDLLTPVEARAAWERWTSAHASQSQRERIDAALSERGYGEGVEGRIRALTEGPWYVAAAVLRERGIDLPAVTPESCLDEATRWKASLR